MKTLYINSDGDLEFDAVNDLKMVEGSDEKKQSIRHQIGTNTGEWFLNTIFGLAYKYVWGKNWNEERIRAELVKSLEQEPRVESVEYITVSFDRPNRKVTINFKAIVDGEEVEDEVTA